MQPTPDNPYAIIVCPHCFGTGYILTRYRETCPNCNGSGRITEVKARELDQRETEAVENALMQRINELESEVSKVATEYAMLLETNRAHLRERGELVMALRAALRTIEQLAAENPLTARDTGIARALAASRALLDGEGGA